MSPEQVDAIVIGAGFGGLYSLHKLRKQGLSARIIEKASAVGGTWYWNRYPGALSDTESYLYRYSFDKDLLQDYTFTTRYLEQPQILEYLEHVTDRFDLRKDIRFNTGMTSAEFDEESELWTVKTDTNEPFICQYLITAVGLLSSINLPKIPGIDSFKGEYLHTGNYPPNKDLTGKKVGIIGTGSTGNQAITALAPKVGHLTVFQRSPQYSVPAGNGPITQEYLDDVKASYDSIWHQVKTSMVCFGFEESQTPAMSVSPEERERVFEENWNKGGGFRFMFGTFSDIATNEEANQEAAKFIRKKIKQIVKDPETAEALTPYDYYARRPLCDSGYYESFNRPNVSLADVKKHPITEITPNGIRTSNGQHHDLDVVLFATGFDAVDGNYVRIPIKGRNGMNIKEHWDGCPKSYQGITTSNFPNLFMVTGPNGPFTNIPPSIELQVEHISEMIENLRKQGVHAIEPTHEAEDKWTEICTEIANQTLFAKQDSWIFGANIPGKKPAVYFFLAGHYAYRLKLQEEMENNYPSYSKSIKNIKN